MRRREFIGFLSLVSSWPFAANAQERNKAYRVGFITNVGSVARLSDPNHALVRPFLEGMRDLGFVEGQNLVLERRSAEGVTGRGADIAADLVRGGIDVIVVTTTFLAVHARRVSSTIPVVMAASTDPVERGLAASLSRPGGNVTGFTVQAGPEYEAKRMQFLKHTVPNLSRVAYFGTKGEWDLPNAKALRSAADHLGLTLKLADYAGSNYSDALSSIERERPDGLFVSLTPLGPAPYKAILAFTLEHRLPTIYPWRQNVVDGGLMSYGIDLADQYRRVAGYVARILKGEKPSEMSIQQPVKFEFVINLKTARAIGLEIPAPVLAQAAEVIE